MHTWAKTEEKRKHNRKTYKTFIFRVRGDSDLAAHLKKHTEEGETSVNFLMSELLSAHFGCKLPQREYTRIKRVRLI